MKGLAAAGKVLPIKPVVETVTKTVTDTAAKRREVREQREHAERLARQVDGRLADVTVKGSPHVHIVVWKDGVPFAAFPHVEGELGDRPELHDMPEHLLYEPRAAKLPRHARRAVKRRE